jgi:hypothetical protein
VPRPVQAGSRAPRGCGEAGRSAPTVIRPATPRKAVSAKARALFSRFLRAAD